MSSTALAPFSDTGSPLPTGTSVSVLATLDINGQTVPISTGDLSLGIKNLKFSLANPVELGSLDNLLDYLNLKVGVPLTSSELTTAINEIPTTPDILNGLRTSLLTIASTTLTIQVLTVDVAAGAFTLGVSFPVDLPLTGFLKIDNIGVVISRGGQAGPPSVY